MFSSPLRVFGIILTSILCVYVVTSILSRECACTDQQECFCINNNDTLSSTTDADLQKIPEPERSEYRAFLDAWETEYRERKQEWANLYSTFHSTKHDAMVERSFDMQLAESHQNFIELFNQRDDLFRERIGL